MRLTRLVATSIPAVVAALAAVALHPAPASAASTVRYVAMGDSYSSGVGTDDTSGSCQRSPDAYPGLFDAAVKPASYAFVACSGATTADVRNTQIASLSSTTTLVSITVGGNDVGFSDVMRTCILDSTDDCVAAVNAAEAKAKANLPGLLGTTYSAIRSKAPKAKVVVLGYPVFYDLGPSVCVGLSRTDHEKIDEGIGILDGIVQTAAGKAGFAFADVRSSFTGHQICDGGDKWLHALNYSDIDESYHPTGDGHSGAYLPVFRKAAGV